MKSITLNNKEFIFTRREGQVIEELLRYKSMKEVGTALKVNERTVCTYWKNIKEKTGIYSKSTLLLECKNYLEQEQEPNFSEDELDFHRKQMHDKHTKCPSFFYGFMAGANFEGQGEENSYFYFGDDILDEDHYPDDAIKLSDKVIIGKTFAGYPSILYIDLKKFIEKM